MKETHIWALINNEEDSVKRIYLEHRPIFIAFGRKYNLDDDALKDIYQEAFIALRKHAIKGRLWEVKSSLRTYLFGIGKHMIFNELKRQNKFTVTDLQVDQDVAPIAFQENTLTQEQLLLQKYFKRLGEKCKTMLTLFYYRGLTIEEITKSEGYENANVVKSTKSRCLRTLRELIKSSSP